MTRIEKSLNPSAGSGQVLTVELDNPGEPLPAVKRMQLLELVGQLAQPQLGLEMRLDLVAQMRHVLNGKTPMPACPRSVAEGARIPPPERIAPQG